MDFKKSYVGGGYGSEFESDAEGEKLKRLRKDLAIKEGQSRVTGGLPSKRVAAYEYDREESKNQRFHFLALDAYNRHKQLVNDYLLYYPGATKDLFQRDTTRDKTDLDVIRENHRFLWNPEDEEEGDWGRRLSKRYWDKLFKEYCIADLSRYKENKIAMRWRVEKEVVEGKGHFTCGNKKCSEQSDLRTWEVNFGYVEHGEKKNALVKLRLCERCSKKLNYHRKCKEVTRKPSKSKVDKKQADSPSRKRHKEKYDTETDKDSGKERLEDGHKDKLNDKLKDSHKGRHEDQLKDSHKEKYKGHKGKHKDQLKDSHKGKHNDRLEDIHKDRSKDRHKGKHNKSHRHARKNTSDDEDRDDRRRHHGKKKRRKEKRRRSESRSESSSSDESSDEEDKSLASEDTSVPESEFWAGPAPVVEEKSREEEMDDFLNDIFL